MNRSSENTWRAVQGKEPLKPMEDIVAEMMHYINTYPKQPGYKDYPDTMFIDDILYGIGKSLSEDYEFAQGFRKFKKVLLAHLQNDPETQTEE